MLLHAAASIQSPLNREEHTNHLSIERSSPFQTHSERSLKSTEEVFEGRAGLMSKRSLDEQSEFNLSSKCFMLLVASCSFRKLDLKFPVYLAS
jgi:hypothetical protein